ncbi:sporulation protein YunB [Methanobrevibacter sp.]|uniref:sporulation protein YunB n=1 Tax=Methanobrevibacter sp. TaxID=66852 RepID=UPI003890BB6D
MRKRQRKSTIRFLSIVLTIILLISLTLEADNRLRVLIRNYSNSKSKILSNLVINQTVYDYLEERQLKYTDLMKINSAEDGVVTSVEFNTVEITKLKAGIISLIQNNINSRDSITMNIPIGTLTGNQYLNNRGPKIKISMQISSAVYSDIKSKFISAGINQTLHQITLSISTEIYFVMPWYRSSGSYNTEFILAETIIVGRVPDAYTNVIEYPGSNIAGEIFDYGASFED